MIPVRNGSNVNPAGRRPGARIRSGLDEKTKFRTLEEHPVNQRISASRVRRDGRLLPAGIAMTLALAGAAGAQEREDGVAAAGEPSTVEEVVVTGFRSVLMKSQAMKMESSSITEALTAEDIGKLPDSSIAESLARLPGLAGERRNGRTSGLSVRGFKEDYVGTMLNGREVLGMGDNRGVEYDLYPAEIIGSVVVYKTPDASLMTQGIGGTVDLRTTRPLQSERTIAINGNYEVNELSSANPDYDDTGHRLSFTYVDQFADDRFGLALTAATMESPSQEQQFRGWGYPTVDPDNPNLVLADGVTLQGDEVVLGGHDSFARSALMQRDSVAAVLQFEPSDALSLTLDALYIDFAEDKVFRGFEEGGPIWGTSSYTISAVEDGLVTAGAWDGFRSVIRNDAESKQAELKTFGLNVQYRFADDWSLLLDGSSGEVSKRITNIESYSGVGRAGTEQGPAAARGFTMTSQGAMYSAHPTIAGPDYTDYDLIRLAGPQPWGGALAPVAAFQPSEGQPLGPDTAQDGFVNRPEFEESLDSLRLQLEGRPELPLISGIKAGVHYSDRSKTKLNNGAFLTAPTWPDDGPIPEEFLVGTTSLGFLGLGDMIAYDSLGLYRSGYYLETDAGRYETARLGDSYTVDETVTTLFAMADLEAWIGDSRLSGNAGLQLVRVDQSSQGYGSVIGEDLQVIATPLHDGDRYEQWLPSLNLSYELAESQFLRMALAKTISRPRMDDLRANDQVSFVFNDASILDGSVENSPWSGSSGNPRLRPLEANQLDLSYEYYFAEDGLLALAFYYKDLVNWHRAVEVVSDFSDYYIPGYHQSSAETGNQPPETFLGVVSTREDGLEGFVRGYELQASLPLRLLHQWLDGAGLLFSAAFSDGELDDGSRVPGLSDEAYQLTAYYERSGFEFRVSGRKRSDFLTETRGLSLSLTPTVDNGAELWDAQIGYDFASSGIRGLEGLSLTLQAQNLTDEDTVQFNEGDPRQVTQYQTFGANYLFGINYRFH